MVKKFVPKLKGARINVNDVFNKTSTSGKLEYRQWIYVEDNIFFCLYCVCFGNEINRNKGKLAQPTIGVNYNNVGSRLIYKLHIHENSASHKYSEKLFLRIWNESIHSNSNGVSPMQDALQSQNPLRNAINCICKIIIYLATHGMYQLQSLFAYLISLFSYFL